MTYVSMRASMLTRTAQLLPLPRDYTQLHALLSAERNRYTLHPPTSSSTSATAPIAGLSIDSPALCLVCGMIFNAYGKGQCYRHTAECKGSACFVAGSTSNTTASTASSTTAYTPTTTVPPNRTTSTNNGTHTANPSNSDIGGMGGMGGTGVFFLLQDCVVIICHGPRMAWYPSPYVDEYGECNQGGLRGRPLFLDSRRYESLRQLWATNGIAQEVYRRRASASRLIILGYY